MRSDLLEGMADFRREASGPDVFCGVGRRQIMR